MHNAHCCLKCAARCFYCIRIRIGFQWDERNRYGKCTVSACTLTRIFTPVFWSKLIQGNKLIGGFRKMETIFSISTLFICSLKVFGAIIPNKD